MNLADSEQRRRCLTDFESVLMVEAAAGTGKTSLMACRVAMMLASGIAPVHIAAITFTEAAAGELARRVHWVVSELLAGRVPPEVRLAIPGEIPDQASENLARAAERLDEITCSTIHAFCQTIIASHAVEVGMDPGARIADEFASQAMFDEAFSSWLVAALSSGEAKDESVLVLAEDEPLEVVRRLRELADLRNRYRDARPPLPDISARPDIVLVEAIDDFGRFVAAYPQDQRTNDIVAELQGLRSHFFDAFATQRGFRDLWALAKPPRLDLMLKRTLGFRAYQRSGAWKKVLGEQGEATNAQATQHYRTVETAFSECLGHVAGLMVSQLSYSLQAALDDYAELKKRAAALDFDDLLEQARNLLATSNAARDTASDHFRYILVDEFQDTDPIQTELLFRIASASQPENWEAADLRPGSLFLVGDPKQSIYRFRGADIAIYARAREVVLKQPLGALIHITANFRSRQPILDYVNGQFAHVFSGGDQPPYVPLSATIPAPDEAALPVVAKLTIHEEDDSPASLRQSEAQAVARLCRDLVGRYPVRRPDGSVSPARPGDIALLAPSYTELWRYERELELAQFGVASQAGKALMRRQETQDVLALLRTLSDPSDRLAFGALLRGPLVGLTDHEIADATAALPADGSREPYLELRTPLAHIANDYAREVVGALQVLYRRARSVPPSQLLAEAVETLKARLVITARHGNRNARALANIDALIDQGRRYAVSGLRMFVRDLQSQWEKALPVQEGRSDSVEDAIELVTMHSAKGLEWPIVIPISTATRFRPAPQFVHRQLDATLHWVLGGLAPPALEQARQLEDRLQACERERMWYVVCTRSRDLLVIPSMSQTDQLSWARVVGLGFDKLSEIDLTSLGDADQTVQAAPENTQTAQQFAAESRVIQGNSTPITWVRPSLHETDRTSSLMDQAETSELVRTSVVQEGAGMLRGGVLHKLLEEVLTAETPDQRLSLAERARVLTDQLLALSQEDVDARPDADEMAATVISTLELPDIAPLVPFLVPELAVWGADADTLLSGRADAVVQVDGKVRGVIDWKSDVDPTREITTRYQAQVDSYLKATGAVAGAIVYLSTLQVIWCGDVSALRRALP